ncbi:DUF7146 domain-containing protein [Tropicimonas sediminicola]|uniref:Toprim domain-containing protein n=1 Tax=Tropicimonas sediminicola TaxID=1031541 RepID=A0A239I0Z5_9RHOB|nr:toprim domain-containing protein [Tropicimonas sediminicola]SNS87227.1 Toprim domain-containing protein [Tropicimonas sediminicola]
MTDAQTLTRALNGKWHGRYGRACCPACNDDNRSNPALSIKQGANGKLLLWCFKGCEFADILDSLRARGIAAGAGTYNPPNATDVLRNESEVEADIVKRAALARRSWQEAMHIGGTLAETYLRNRGITSPLPETLRFHPNCWHATGKRLPAMLARIDCEKYFGLHRTYLTAVTGEKSGVTPNKAMLGSAKGGGVRLREAPGPLVVAEGIETALSLSSGLLERFGSLWAALSVSGMTGLRLPDVPHELVIACDGDKAGRTAAFTLAERATSRGWRVSVADPGDGLDFNDLLQRGTAA